MRVAKLNATTLTRLSTLFLIAVALTCTSVRLGASQRVSKLDPMLQKSATLTTGHSPVIVRAAAGMPLSALQPLIKGAGGTVRRSLPRSESQVALVPNAALAALAASPAVRSVSLDRVVVGATERTGITVGATAVRQELGYDGSGVGVVIIDSGVTPSHDDLADATGAQRVRRFVDFVNGAERPYDDYGHGTHVAGIIAGNGFDSGGARSGIAPGAGLIMLKALDGSGRGRISDVIAALDYAIDHRDALNIRVINLSLAAGVYESFTADPLTLATERAVKAGIVVVAASGNNGVSPAGITRYRGVTAPGNAPWVLTVGGSSHMGTVTRVDDTVAEFSSRGPGAIDHAAKPDVVAPSIGIESLAAPDSALYSTWSQFLLSGTVTTTYLPYLSMSGTSMAAPTVSGTVALMLQANPGLTPNAVKGILQYTAQARSSYDPLTQGAGFLNAHGAVQLAKYLAAPSSTVYPDATVWSRRLIWGNYLVKNGRLTADASAWSPDVVWGATSTPSGGSIEWGIACTSSTCDSTVGRWSWSQSKPRNVVWGTMCGGGDCSTTWTLAAISGASEGDTVVWGTTGEGETVVWGTTGDGDTVVWGTFEDVETVVWGTNDVGDTVVWGTSCESTSCIPVIWR